MFPELGVRRALLLQGPMGPFFWRLAQDMREAGVEVTKVNLNAGDGMFYPRGALAYRGSFADWPDYVRKLLRERAIDGLFVFGDGRPYHRKAIEVAEELGIEVFVFEEGYLRPDYITLERGGVNGYSRMPKDPEFFRRMAHASEARVSRPTPVGPTFRYAAWYSTLYSVALTLGFFLYPRYRHHRPLNAFAEAFRWVRGGVRKLIYKVRERRVTERLIKQHDHKYFLVALQVHQDYQLRHSRFRSVPDFIDEVVTSFARHAPADNLLVFKHHPMDRAYTDYGRLLKTLGQRHGLGERIVYVHDLHLPTLLRCARGAVMINSTVGLTSVQYGTPVKALGDAIYNMPGLTCPKSLEEFWVEPSKVDLTLWRAFRAYLLAHNQLAGNLYRRPSGTRTCSGIQWPAQKETGAQSTAGGAHGGHEDPSIS